MPTIPDEPSPVCDRDRRRVTMTDRGPILVEGPVRVVTADGTEFCCDRFLVAICTCHRSDIYPLCDTSHRRRRHVDPDDR